MNNMRKDDVNSGKINVSKETDANSSKATDIKDLSNPVINMSKETDANSDKPTDIKDLSNPVIVVELNDHEAMLSLATKMRNYEVPEGTVIQVTGTVFRNTSTPSLMADISDGAKIGISVFIDDAPDDKTPAEGETVTIVGVAQMGEYFMEYHANMENIK